MALLEQLDHGLEPLGVAADLGLGPLPGDHLVLQLEHLLLELAHQPVVVEEQHLLFRRFGRGGRVRKTCPGDHLPDHGQQLFRLGRLHQEAVRAAAPGQGLVLGIGVGAGVDEDGQVVQAGVGADLAAELKAVHHRHEDVADHQVEGFGGEQFQGLATVCGTAHGVAVAAEQNLQQVAGLPVVIHGEKSHTASRSVAQPARWRRISSTKVVGSMGFSM